MGRNGRGKGGKKKRGKQTKKRLPELRFRVGDRVEWRIGADDAESLENQERPLPVEYVTGTVFKTWYRAEEAEESDVAPYLVHLDDGASVIVPKDADSNVRASASPGIPLDYARGARIECKLREGDGFCWRPGHMIKANGNWAEENDAPYSIQFDHEGEKDTYFFPPAFIRPIDLRFKLGDRVDVAPDDDDDDYWVAGTIVQLSVEKRCGYIAPYLVRLDCGEPRVVHYDIDELLRESDAPPIVVKFARGSSVECKLEDEDNEWVQGTVVQSNEDWFEHDRAPYFIKYRDGGLQPFWGPNDCIRASSVSSVDLVNLDSMNLQDGIDVDLFAPFPPRPECPICFLPFPIDGRQDCYRECCGKVICMGCYVAHATEPELDDKCPFCRAPTSELLCDRVRVASCRKRMEANDAEGMVVLGQYYESGRHGLQKDEKKAFDLFLRAAELGSAIACTKVAHKIGYKSSKGRTFEEKAAKLGCIQSRYNLGMLEFEDGNVELAIRHWKIAAVVGLEEALSRVLWCFKVGVVSKSEYEEILRCSQRAMADEWSEQRELVRSLDDSRKED
ncbi:hypothetical protein ACHAWF_008295 [Thalassiosira exigua]